MLQENNYELNIGNHREFTNLLCSSFTRIGAAILTYPDPADNSLTITLILVIFDGDDTSNYPNCVNPKEGSAGQGKFTFFINIFFLIYHYNWFAYLLYLQTNICYIIFVKLASSCRWECARVKLPQNLEKDI